METSPSRAIRFDPLDDILTFPLPTPPLSLEDEDEAIPIETKTSHKSLKMTFADDAGGVQDDMDLDIDAEFAQLEAETEERSKGMDRIRGLGSPPPDFDEEPEDWDEQGPSDSSPTALSSRLSNKSHGASQGLFGDSDIFGPGPIASTSRARAVLTPPPDLPDLPSVFDPIPSTTSTPLPSLRAETASGRSISFKRRTKPRAAEIRHKGKDAHDYLAVPLHRLLAEVDEMKSRDKALELQAVFDADHRARASLHDAGPSSGAMWVDKYRPKKFSDLLGEDRIHRDVLNWLKEWDKCVFRRANPVKKRRFGEDEENSEWQKDSLDRPRERILLLAGPPGYGKTTLAHIIARQAGYKTLEINASDDRSASTVGGRIKNALEAGTGLASEGRPTCVVIDEIDGASGGGDSSFVRSLIKLIQDVPARKKTNTPAKLLRRPIICICNDLYANSLRPLRPFARIVRFRKPQAQALIKRLREICEKETLEADLRVLTMLVEVTTGDVRSCLNTLQFIKSKSSTVTVEAIRSSSVGLKDSGTTIQSVWNDIFIPVTAKDRRKKAGIDSSRYVDRLVNAIQSCGEYEKLLQDLFEHYPQLKPLDASLANLCKVHDWMGYYDRVWGKVNETQEYELMGYLPYALVPWHSHMAAPANSSKPTEWPKADYESYQSRVANEEIATNLKDNIPPILRSTFSATTTLTELVPLMMRIISPPLRPVNANIVKPAERATLSRLVELMIPHGLSFWQEKAENGQPMMRLEPPIDVFVHYEGKRADDIAASRFAVRQLVAQAMDAEIARRKGGSAEETTGAESLKGMYGAVKRGSGPVQDLNKTEVVASDFFGRKIVKPLPETGYDDAAELLLEPVKKRFRAVYKFHEGSLSAVRKNIKMSMLM